MPKANDNKTADPRQRKKRVRQLEIVEEPSFLRLLWTYVKTHLLGQVLASLLLAVFIVLLDLVLAGDAFDHFAMLIGIEVILFLLGLWIFYWLKGARQSE